MGKHYKKNQTYTESIDNVTAMGNRIIYIDPEQNSSNHINFGSIDAHEGEEVKFVYKGGNEAELVSSDKSNNPFVAQKTNKNDLVNGSL